VVVLVAVLVVQVLMLVVQVLMLVGAGVGVCG
jgi:hypothetical protein